MKKIILQYAAVLGIIGIAAYVFADGPQPSVGLYWYDSKDPTTGAGMSAPLNQLLVRTDTPSLYYKSSSANTGWTRIGTGTSSGGTVTSLSSGLNIALSPNPITTTGTVATVASPTFTNITMTGRGIDSPCLVNFGSTLPGGEIDNWDPACLGTNTVIQVTAADNTGTLVTGIDAVDNALPIGSRATVCNESSTADDGVLAFSSLDSASAVGNRILTPGTGEQRTCSITTSTSCQVNADCPGGETCSPSDGARYYVGPDQCVTLRLINGGASISKMWPEWIVEAPIRSDYGVVQNLNIFPTLPADAIVGGSTVDDYNPTCTGGFPPCSEGGNDNAFLSNTLVSLSTTNSTAVTIKGFHYASDIHSPTQGQVKVIENLGPAQITLANQASAFPLDQIVDGANSDNRGDIVMNPATTVWLYHFRDSGGWVVIGKRDYWFSERDVNITKGAQISGPSPNSAVPNTSLLVDKTADAGSFLTYVRDVHAYAAQAIHYGLTVAQGGTGLASGQNRALLLSPSGTSPYSIEIDNGGVYFGLGSTLQFGYFNIGGTDGADFSNSGPVKVEGQFRVNGGAFTGEAKTKICSPTSPSSVSNGTLSSDATNCMGRVTAIGSNTSTTLTFGGGGFANTSHCFTQVASSGAVGLIIVVTPSNTAPVFSCVDSTTGAAANCPNFEYQCWGN